MQIQIFEELMEAQQLKDEKLKEDFFINLDPNKDIGDYFTYLDNISKALSKRLEDLENENQTLKNELLKLKLEDDEIENRYLASKEQMESITNKYNDLMEKFEKEQKRAKLLELENARNMDDLKSLRKENKILVTQTSDNVKETLMEKIHRLIK